MRENVFYTVDSCVFVPDHTPEYAVVRYKDCFKRLSAVVMS